MKSKGCEAGHYAVFQHPIISSMFGPNIILSICTQILCVFTLILVSETKIYIHIKL
jgi:hypothetical protein